MYVPRIRRIETVLKEMKAADCGTVISRHLLVNLLREHKITPLKYGDAWAINLDELYGYFCGQVFVEAPYIPSEKRTIMTTGEIVRLVQSEDADTKIRKLNLRLFTQENNVWYFVSSAGNWLIDANELFYRLNPRGVNKRADMPRLRWHDDTVRNFSRRHPELKITIRQVEEALQDERIFKIKNGGRWIINYDQLEMVVAEKYQ